MAKLLYPDLVPSSCWFNNVRSSVSSKEWKDIRNLTFLKHGKTCYFCGSKPKSLDCHEIWEYSFGEPNIQSLADIIPLCKQCHQVCHIGFWSSKGKYEPVLKHFMKVRSLSRSDAEEFIEHAFEVWSNRSALEYELDISYLEVLKDFPKDEH